MEWEKFEGKKRSWGGIECIQDYFERCIDGDLFKVSYVVQDLNE